MLFPLSKKFLKNGDLVLSFKQPQETIQLTSKLETTLDFDFINYTKQRIKMFDVFLSLYVLAFERFL